MNFIPRTLANGRICCSNERALCDTCKAHFTADASTYDPPDPYAAGISALRAARATSASIFEDEWKTSRLASLASEADEVAQLRAAHEARTNAQPKRRMLTAAELQAYEAPDPYFNDLQKLRSNR